MYLLIEVTIDGVTVSRVVKVSRKRKKVYFRQPDNALAYVKY